MSTTKLQVIGDPVLHSLSPRIHGAMLQALGMDTDVSYDAHTVPQGGLPEYLAWAQENGISGFNATMPHKEDLLPLMDSLDDSAQLAQAVNTVCLRDGKWVGFNTDGAGCLEAMKEAGMDPYRRYVLLFGAGGAASAVVPALLGPGKASRVWVCNRDPLRAKALCSRITGPAVGFPLNKESIPGLASSCTMVVNCTSCGMEGTQNQFEDFSFLEDLPPAIPVFDLVYHPAETELLRRARELGHPTSNGLGMLIWQAVLSLEIFLNRPLDRPALVEAARKAVLSA